MVSLEIVVAAARNNAIGLKGQIPWHLKEDLQHFKAVTMGHPIVMGRRTFESIGRILPGRRNILISRTFGRAVDGLEVVSSLNEAMALVKDGPLMVTGGARLYAEALPKCAVLHLTRIDRDFEGDTFFPEFNRDEFDLVACERFESESLGCGYTFETLRRRAAD